MRLISGVVTFALLLGLLLVSAGAQAPIRLAAQATVRSAPPAVAPSVVVRDRAPRPVPRVVNDEEKDAVFGFMLLLAVQNGRQVQ